MKSCVMKPCRAMFRARGAAAPGGAAGAASAPRLARPFAGVLVPVLAFVLGCAVFALGQAPAAAGALTGEVVNGATGRPAAGVVVSLINAQNGVKPAATTRSDATGAFHFTAAESAAATGAGGALLEADFQGVPYFQSVAAGAASARLKVFPLAPNARLRLSARVTVVQPERGQLAVVDEYVLDNGGTTTWYKPGGLFRFRVPRNVQPDGARVIGPSGMAIERNAEPTREAGLYRLDYPFRPGETRLQVSYRLPYAAQRAEIRDDTPFPVDHVVIYVPPPMKLLSAGFNPLPADQGYQVFEAQSTTAPVSFTVSGTAPLPQEIQAAAVGANGGGGARGAAIGAAAGGAGGSGANGSGGASAAAGGDPAAAAAVGLIPPKTWLETNFLSVLAVLLILAATAFGFLWTRPRAAVAGGGPAPPPPGLPPTAGGGAKATAGPAPAGGSGLDAALSRLKDDLFLLEVRRNTGDIAPAEYDRARAELDARLRALKIAP